MPEAKTAAGAGEVTPKAKEADSPAATTVLPMRSVADEAAQKAKEMRLKSLREKVHGKKSEKDDEAKEKGSSASAASDKPKPTIDTSKANESLDPGLQSPTSSAWKNVSVPHNGDETAQSPTSSIWRAGTSASTHSGPVVIDAAVSKIGAIEKEETIQEVSEKEDGEENVKEENDTNPTAPTPVGASVEKTDEVPQNSGASAADEKAIKKDDIKVEPSDDEAAKDAEKSEESGKEGGDSGEKANVETEVKESKGDEASESA